MTASADCTIRKWDMTTLECLYVYEGHTSRVQKLIVTGEFIFSSAYDNTARMWLFEHEDNFEGNDGDPCLRTFMGHTKGVYPLIFIPSEDFDLTDGATINPGDTLLTGSADQVGKYLQQNLGAKKLVGWPRRFFCNRNEAAAKQTKSFAKTFGRFPRSMLYTYDSKTF